MREGGKSSCKTSRCNRLRLLIGPAFTCVKPRNIDEQRLTALVPCVANGTQTIAYSFAKYQMAREGEQMSRKRVSALGVVALGATCGFASAQNAPSGSGTDRAS